MFKRFFQGCLALFLATTASFAPMVQADEVSATPVSAEQMAQWLPGQWWFDFAEDDVQMRGVTEYSSDGKVTYTGIVIADDQKVEMKLVGKWQINGHYLKVEITESNVPEMMPVGLVNQDVIVAIDAEKFSYQNPAGQEFTEKRLPKTSAI